MSIEENKKSYVYKSLFKASMLWRTFYGTLKIIFGLILLRILSVGLSGFSYNFIGHELIKDPNDFFVKIIEMFINRISIGTGTFIAFYLIFWGIVDAFFSFYILKKKMWAYPVSLVLIGSFTLYEIFRFFHTFSITLFFIILIDIIIFILINKEYSLLKKTHLLERKEYVDSINQ